jgi:DNA (cytosine-5)-methyltransferase 1
MATRSRLHVLELCAGYGGFSLGLRLAEPSARTVCYVEIEAYAAAILVAQMERGGLDPAPIWSDLATFDGKPWRGAVDCITAGFPCQPWSAAGKQLGEEDDRWIWPDIARIIGEVRPGRVFLENVSLDAFRRPRADLEDLGYRVPPAVRISAEAVGAPHRRERWWCLASDADGSGLEGWHSESVCRGSVEWPSRTGDSQALPERVWPAEPPVCGVDDGGAASLHRVDRLRALGNGVVPQCVAAAWVELNRRLG